MMGRRSADQQSLFYAFNLDEIVPTNHLLRRIDPFITEALGDLHAELAPSTAISAAPRSIPS